MSATQKIKNQEGIVIFAGAGCSMASPSLLPGWNDLNDAILNALWDKLEPYGLNTQYREKILTTIKQKRFGNTFPPDYQAQIMVERSGIKYFELLSAVDSDTYNPVHYYAASLAKAGLLKAIVTTNFDKNFERAFTRLEVNYKSYLDEEGFNALAKDYETTIIPVIKIHGCCSSPASMIDTRKQRLKGRTKSLENGLLQLLQNHHFIFGGYSGQDLDDSENYLGLKSAAYVAKGFTYLHLPGTSIRESMLKLINYYGENKAESIACDPVEYLERILKSSEIQFDPFAEEMQGKLSIERRLKIKIAALEPMDAANMLIALAESYGDEISGRFLYDKVFKARIPADYGGEALSRFLLNHSRSYVFNFQNRKERAESAKGFIVQGIVGDLDEDGEEMNTMYTNPAKFNLRHERNTSPEAIGLLALEETYLSIPDLFAGFPQRFYSQLPTKPSNTEDADIIYYYSYYALLYGDLAACISYLDFSIYQMENEFDEPRLSQLLSRRAMLKLRENTKEMIESAEIDAMNARFLAIKYHEPHLLAISALALAICARKKTGFDNALKCIKEAESIFSELKRIPQYVETIIEYLKLILLVLEDDAFDKKSLFETISSIIRNEGNSIIRTPVYEPEYCYLIGMIYWHHSDVEKQEVLKWFSDSICLAEQFHQDANYNYFKETFRQMNILDEVERV